jgi:hypothetical protein
MKYSCKHFGSVYKDPFKQLIHSIGMFSFVSVNVLLTAGA